MKLFTIDKDGKLIQFKERTFAEKNSEIDLEILLEKNPEYFLENSNVLMIGRQVTTNLNTFIDLLGIDKEGNTVVVELKREKTPRETVAQILEYTSFVENLSYEQLNKIYQEYSGDEMSLEEYHQQFFQSNQDSKVAFNKSSKLMIVAQNISTEIKQTALYLRKKGIDIYCLEFKYFLNKSNESMISSDYVVGEDEFIKSEKIKSEELPKVDEKQFAASLNKYGEAAFKLISNFAKENSLIFRWGSKGFSLNLPLVGGFVGLCFGYPPNSVFKQSIYTGFEELRKKVPNHEKIISFYKEQIDFMNCFLPAKSNYKWIIDESYKESDMEKYLIILKQVIEQIKHETIELKAINT
jgi:hypothetical protein